MIWRKSTPAVEPQDKGPKGFDDYEVRLGDILRGERATLGKSLLDVQRELHIRAAHIAAIENGDLAAFEAPSFIAGFVRSYARYLDLDPEAVYAQFCAEHGFAVAPSMGNVSTPRESRPFATPPLHEPGVPGAPGARSRGAEARPGGTSQPGAIKAVGFLPDPDPFWRRVEPGALGSITILVALIGGLGFAGWTVLQEVQRVQVAPADMMPNVVTDLDPLAGQSEVTTGMAASEPDMDTDPLRPATGSGAVGQVRVARPEALDVPVLVPRDGPIAAIGVSDENGQARQAPAISTDAAVSAALADLLPAEDQPAGTAPRVVNDGPPVVQILAVRPSWMRVRGADGSVIFERILDAGETWVLPQTEDTPSLHAGNSGSVYFLIDGQAYGPAAPGANVVRNISLAVSNLTESYQLADLTRDQDLAVHVARLQTAETAED